MPVGHVELCGMDVLRGVERLINPQGIDSQAMMGLSPGRPEHAAVALYLIEWKGR